MSISPQLGGEHRVEIPAGAISYRACGNGSPIVLVHGVGVNGDLWRRVVPRLADGHYCITPDLPWGSHSLPLKPDTDLSLPGMARITADFREALDLDNVALVANDTQYWALRAGCFAAAAGSMSATAKCQPIASPTRCLSTKCPTTSTTGGSGSGAVIVGV
jgi:pimeloyl-ACP methyl ester carboxylesterase